MENFYIQGGIPLRGEYRVKGAKNSALPILAATVCRGGVYEIYDCPHKGIDHILAKANISEYLS